MGIVLTWKGHTDFQQLGIELVVRRKLILMHPSPEKFISEKIFSVPVRKSETA